MVTQKTAGWLVFLAALGVMLGLIGNEVKGLTSWVDATTTEFVGKALIHTATVIAAFVGGKLIPTANGNGAGR